MAKPPPCKVCGSPHWLNQPHVWPDAVKPSKVVTLPTKTVPLPAPASSDLDAYKAMLRERNARYQQAWRDRQKAR